jgi:HEPN domain-containing protein
MDLLRELEEQGVPVPQAVKDAIGLTKYAVRARYPGVGPPITREGHEEALRLARTVLDWARGIVAPSEPESSEEPS